MGKHDICSVGPCANTKRKPDDYVIKGHVEKLVFHRIPHKDPAMRKQWELSIQRGRLDFEAGDWTYVCSNHFKDGKPTSQNPYPTEFLTPSDLCDPSPRKRPKPTRHSTPKKAASLLSITDVPASTSESEVSDVIVAVPLTFQQIDRDFKVRFYTGLPNTDVFKTLFEHLMKKAEVMEYWEGPAKALTSASYESSYDSILTESLNLEEPIFSKRGRKGKLSHEQQLLLTLMRIRLALLVEDLAFRFRIAESTVSKYFATWIKLCRKELSVLIIWPSKEQIQQSLPSCFKKEYPEVRTIIDCSEIFVETPSSLEVQAVLWSDYKHHCTAKFLVCITPNGAVSWVSPCYGGKASDVHVVRDSGFLEILEPYDKIMADRGFKIKTDLAWKLCKLCIPPSASKNSQMTAADVELTSSIANVRIYVEQAIKRLKDFRILSNDYPMLQLPLIDDVLITCCALVNLLPPLADD